jgi:hypothetical protein
MFVILVFAVGGLLKTSSQSQSDSGQQKPIRPYSILGRAMKAKASGLTKVTFPAPKTMPVHIASLDIAFAHLTVVIARPVEKRSYLLDPNDITSVYILEILETLSESNSREVCCVPTSVPTDMTPLKEGQIYLVNGGGTMELAGVEVTVVEEAGGFSPAKTYLLFLNLDESKKIGDVRIAEQGVYEVNADNTFEPVDKKTHGLRELLLNAYGNSLERLKDDLKMRQPKQ